MNEEQLDNILDGQRTFYRIGRNLHLTQQEECEEITVGRLYDLKDWYGPEWTLALRTAIARDKNLIFSVDVTHPEEAKGKTILFFDKEFKFVEKKNISDQDTEYTWRYSGHSNFRLECVLHLNHQHWKQYKFGTGCCIENGRGDTAHAALDDRFALPIV